MLDSTLRPLIDPPLNAAARVLAAWGVSANALTLVGLVLGLAAGGAIASGAYGAGLALIVTNRLLDGLDGADLFADFVFYAAVPAGFALAHPSNALPAALLLAGFLLSGISFLGYAVLADRRGLTTIAQGEKSFYYVAGLAEGAETIAVFVLATLRPDWFPPLAFAYAALCGVTGFARLAMAWRQFR
jgi:phosphatidylglycerophosphate synthase